MDKPHNLVAIDPGKRGAIVTLTSQGVKGIKMPETDMEIIYVLSSLFFAHEGQIHYIIEHPPKTTGMKRPESTGFVLGENYGLIKGCVMALGASYELVIPQKWQKMYQPLPKQYKAKKDALWQIAKELYPEVKVLKSVADGFLLLNYFMNKE